MSQPRVLIQLDSDPHPSVFDAVVAVDAGVEHLLQYSSITPGNVQALVHGAIFTRGPDQLKNTAIFVGGSDVAVGDCTGQEIKRIFFGPIRVSVMLDGNGSNTTAAAAVLCVARHLPLEQVNALILGSTGPVGQRVARLLLCQGASVCLASRDNHRAQELCDSLIERFGEGWSARISTASSGDASSLHSSLDGKNVVMSCGAAGIQLLPDKILNSNPSLCVAIDLNAVPPSGIEGIGATDRAVARGKRLDYGAIGVGGLKMKIHREALQLLFSRNDLFLDAEQILEIGKNIESALKS
ncbi:MAG: bifunctional NADP-dependent methylenetetrahydromethanopterin dehydrogenase/methylenetetrahydrofolate dehydrogenase [Planctomycetales bacterium]|nr:bifunctional NADP-dependent methylenetetrahydromethanopterin dehydrogenase/methylenetetrahydrofolate dehydrogenase [Planctomycetales bacterium]